MINVTDIWISNEHENTLSMAHEYVQKHLERIRNIAEEANTKRYE